MVEADAVGDLEVIRRIERDPLVALRQGNRAQDLQIAARGRQFLDARLVQDQIDERRGAAVHDRHFRRFSSTITLSMPSAVSAESRCSTVSTDTASRVSPV